jgi:hypothetical protein
MQSKPHLTICVWLQPADAMSADATAFSGQALCNSCSCAIFNGLFDALAGAGHSVTSVDRSINNCAENLWQGLLDANALPQQTQIFLSTCKPGDCVYSAATSAVVAMDVDYQAPNCPLSVKQFASSVPLRQAVVTACGELLSTPGTQHSQLSYKHTDLCYGT